MISSLRGTITEIEGAWITIDVNGVGYQTICTSTCRSRFSLGSKAEIIIYTDVKEDSIRLYGFEDKLEKQVFILLTRVKGVGSKTALEIISRVEKKELLRIIGAGDLTKLQSIKGIGKKTAERIIVELKDKVAEFAIEHKDESLRVESEVYEPKDDAISALQALGFSKKDAERAVNQVDISSISGGIDAGNLVREALRYV